MPNDPNKEREALLLEISDLKQQLLWYKRTYEERSLFGILYERIFRQKRGTAFNSPKNFRFRLGQKVRLSKASGSALVPRRILCSIVNHNHSENAASLYKALSPYFDLVLLDSGSTKPPVHSVRFANIYYSGLLNEAYSIARKNGYEYLLFICSDVLIKASEARKLYDRLRELDYDKVGVYSPASKGGGHFFCKKSDSGGLRVVPFVEGFMFLCDVELLEKFCPVDTKENLYGWGLDIAKGFFSRQSGKVCLIDDDVEVEHLEGTGYSRETAEYEMLSWMKSLKNDKMINFFEEQVAAIKAQEESTKI